MAQAKHMENKLKFEHLSFVYFTEHTHTQTLTHWQKSRVAVAVIINCKFDKQLLEQQQQQQQQPQLQNRQHASRPETLHDKRQLGKLLLKSAIFISQLAVNYACIVLNRAHTHTRTLW